MLVPIKNFYCKTLHKYLFINFIYHFLHSLKPYKILTKSRRSKTKQVILAPDVKIRGKNVAVGIGFYL